MRQGDVTSRGRNPDRRLQRGKQADAARAALFTRAPEDEEAARPDGCIWCGHPATSHQWDYLPEGGDTRHMRLNVMECFDCADELSTHQAICYVRPGLNGWRVITRRGAGQAGAAPTTTTRESRNGGRPGPPASLPSPEAKQPPANPPPTPSKPEPPPPEPPPQEPTPASPGSPAAQQLALWPAS